MSARKDIRAYFIEGLNEVSNLYDTGADVSLSKGLFVRAPYIAYPTKTDFVDSKKYLSGLNPFTNQKTTKCNRNILFIYEYSNHHCRSKVWHLVLPKHHQGKIFKNGCYEEEIFQKTYSIVCKSAYR